MRPLDPVRPLKNQDPFPALVINRAFNIILANESTDRRFGLLFDQQKLWGSGPRNIVKMFLSEDGLRPHIEDWERIAQWVMEQVYRQAHEGIGDPASQQLFEEYLNLPGVRALWNERTGSGLDPCQLRILKLARDLADGG